MTETKRISASDLYAALAKRYAARGMRCSRRSVAARAGRVDGGQTRWRWVWPSRGLYLHGFEIKVHRNDWLRELKNPAKAEEIAGYCHFWWVVATRTR